MRDKSMEVVEDLRGRRVRSTSCGLGLGVEFCTGVWGRLRRSGNINKYHNSRGSSGGSRHKENSDPTTVIEKFSIVDFISIFSGV